MSDLSAEASLSPDAQQLLDRIRRSAIGHSATPAEWVALDELRAAGLVVADVSPAGVTRWYPS